MSAVITLSGVGKRYVKYEDTPLLLSTVRNIGRRTRRSALWALRGVDLEVGPGESVGIVGRNGAGKSTLLQLLGGVTAPTEGVVRVRGRVAPLISVGVGFHPELTGRENVYVNATILGLSEREIDRKFDEIVAFSEIESFIDTPVKFYSSGMFVRLGFAVAIEARPDILLVDEVLAVGDFPFQMKSFRRMQEVRENGTTLVVVSHNLFSLGALCDRGLVVSGGGLAFDGSMFDAIGRYHQETPAPSEGPEDESAGRTLVPGVAEVTGVELVGSPGHAPGHVQAGESVTVRVTVRAHREVPRPFVGLIVLTESMDMCVYSDNNHSQPCPPLSAGDVASYDVTFAADLPTGTYAVRTLLHELVAEGDMVGLARSSTLRFYVSGRPLVGGVTDLRARFAPAGSGPS